MDNWEIIDEQGVIHSGPEHEMRPLYIRMATGETSGESGEEEWVGDLKLVQVHSITR